MPHPSKTLDEQIDDIFEKSLLPTEAEINRVKETY